MESKKENLSRDFCLGLVNDLETIKRWELKDSRLAIALADFIFGHRRDIRNYALDLEPLNDLVERLAPVLQTENAMNSLPEQGEVPSPSGSGFLTSDILLNSDFLADRILPWVQLVRTELFSSDDAPFSSIKEAENWIQEQAKDQRLLPIGGHLDERFRRLISSGRVQVAVPPERTLEYPGEDGKVHHVTMIYHGIRDWRKPELRQQYIHYPALLWLDNETRIMARATGFVQPSLVQFVLVGRRPFLPRYLVRVEAADYQATPAGGDILQPLHLEIEIRARDLGFEELRQIYQTYRHTQPRKAKAFKEEHWAIYRLVKEKGGPVSGKGSVQFWKSVMEQWNLHSEKRYSHWKGIKIVYERINIRLENRQQLRNSQEVQERRQK